jgi:hypothetical protein
MKGTTMIWDAIGAIGQVLGSLAVLVTLVYLAIQIRETRRAVIAQSHQSQANAVADLQIQIAVSEPIIQLLQKTVSVEGVDEISDSERLRLRLVQRAIMNQLDNVCLQHSQGYVTDEVFDDALNSARIYRPVWNKLGMDLRPSLAKALSES